MESGPQGRQAPLAHTQPLATLTVSFLLRLYCVYDLPPFGCVHGPALAVTARTSLGGVEALRAALSAAVVTTPSLSLAYRTARFRLLLWVSVAVWQPLLQQAGSCSLFITAL